MRVRRQAATAKHMRPHLLTRRCWCWRVGMHCYRVQGGTAGETKPLLYSAFKDAPTPTANGKKKYTLATATFIGFFMVMGGIYGNEPPASESAPIYVTLTFLLL